jgi:hypothetical protein
MTEGNAFTTTTKTSQLILTDLTVRQDKGIFICLHNSALLFLLDGWSLEYGFNFSPLNVKFFVGKKDEYLPLLS